MSRVVRPLVLLVIALLLIVRPARAQTRAQFTWPANGATGVDLSQQKVAWTTITGAQAYYLYIGTTVGASNLVNSGETPLTSWPVCDVPTGQVLYARIQTKLNNVWYSGTDISFTATNSPPCKATMTQPAGLTPQPTSGLPAVDLTSGFAWTNVPNATAYYLYVGTTVGATDLTNTGEITQTSYLAIDLPVGPTLYVRLWTKAGSWRYLDYTLTASAAPVGHATFIYPTDRAIQVDPAPAFKWTTVPSVQSYYLYVGTTLGANNLVNTGEIQATTYAAPTLPANATLYARLWTKLAGVWRYVDITFSVRAPGVTANGCSAQPGTMIYGQNWSKGVAPQAMPNQPLHDGYEDLAYATAVPFGGPDPVDTLYPEIAWSRSVTVVQGLGPAGENVLDFNPAGTQYGENYQSTALAVGGFGSIAEGCMSISYQWTTAAWDQAPAHGLLITGDSDDGLRLMASRDSNDVTRGQFSLGYSVPAYPRFVNVLVQSPSSFTRAATDNQWQTFVVRWKAGTIIYGVSYVASDGWLRVYWNGDLLFDVENIPLVLDPANQLWADKASHLGWVRLEGLAGPSTNLEVVDTRVAPSSCVFTLLPASGEVDGTAHAAAFQVTTSDTCSWNATSDVSWLHVPVTGSAQGVVTLTVDSNTTSNPRTGVITLGNASNRVTYSVIQWPWTAADSSAPSCAAMSLWSPTIKVSPSGGLVTTMIYGPTGCKWTISTQANWVSAIDAAGVGAGLVRLNVLPNTDGDYRLGTLTIAGRPFTVLQDGTAVRSPAAQSAELQTSSLLSSEQSGCEFSVFPDTVLLPSVGGTAKLRVISPTGCVPSISASASWISITTIEDEQVNPPILRLFIGALSNPSADARSGSVQIGYRQIYVDQSGASDEPGVPSSDNVSISWGFVPDPDKVDRCMGNCGGGCGSFFSVCGGEQKWHYRITGPARFAGQTTTKATCQAGQLVETLYNVYTAPAHFEYHGKWSDGCDSHDGITRWNFIPGVAILAVIPYDLTICSGAFDKVWAYDAVVTGISTLLRTQTGEPCGNSR